MVESCILSSDDIVKGILVVEEVVDDIWNWSKITNCVEMAAKT